MQITVGQALLLLIEKNQYSVDVRSNLEDLYLNGATSSRQKALEEVLQDSFLNGYEISRTPEATNDDPSRRYFETHLCYETLQSLLAKIEINHLKAMNAYYFATLKRMLKPHDIHQIKCVLDVKSPAETKKSNLEKEISDALCRLESRKAALQENDTQKKSDIEKMQLFIHAAFLGIVLGNTLKDCPLQQHDISIYHAENKGRKYKVDNDKVSTLNYGILKGHMPLSADDAARVIEPFLYLKPSEQSTFKPQAAWPQKNFDLLVHPYSNGISSTIVNQLKVILHGFKHAPKSFSWLRDDFQHFFSGFIATLLYQSGGHTLHEFVAPFSLPEVVDIYQTDLQIDTSKLSLSALFNDDNSQAMTKAFKKAIEYNHRLLIKAKMHHEILTAFPTLRKTGLSLTATNVVCETKSEHKKAKLNQ